MTLCFGWKRPCFEGLTFKNRDRLGSWKDCIEHTVLCVWYVWIHYRQLSMYTSKQQTDIVDISGSSVMSWFTIHQYVAPIATVDRKMNKWVPMEFLNHQFHDFDLTRCPCLTKAHQLFQAIADGVLEGWVLKKDTRDFFWSKQRDI